MSGLFDPWRVQAAVTDRKNLLDGRGGLRRPGYAPESVQLFCKRVSTTKTDSWIGMMHGRSG